MKLTSNDKSNIRTLALLITQYPKDHMHILKTIDTGSNIYIIVANYKLGDGLGYFVRRSGNKDKKPVDIEICKVNEHCIQYDTLNNTIRLPNSVLNYIKVFDRIFKIYMENGDKAFN